jgi:hypothetical protein
MGKRNKAERPKLQQLLDDRAAANRADWARRHPAKAAAERKLRKERAGDAHLLEAQERRHA